MSFPGLSPVDDGHLAPGAAGEADDSSPAKRAIPQQVKVQIDVSDRYIEQSLTARNRLSVVMRDLLPELQRQFPDVDFHTKGAWTLAKEGGQALDRRESLADQEVFDGNRLILTEVFSDQVYKPLIEDPADAAAAYNVFRFPSFSVETARALGLIGMVIASIAFAAIDFLAWKDSSSALWWTPPVAIGAVATIAGAYAARSRWGSTQVAYTLVLASAPLLFMTGFTIVPPDGGADGRFTAANFFAGAVLTIAGLLVLGRTLRLGIATLTAIVGTAIFIGLASALYSFTELENPAVPAIIVIVALIICGWSAVPMALSLAQLRPANLQPPGEDLDRSEIDEAFHVDTFDDERTTELSRSSEDTVLERTASAANRFLTGIYIAVALTIVTAAIAAIEPGTHYIWGELIVAVLATITLFLRGRSMTDRVQGITFFVASGVLAIGTLAVMTAGAESNAGRLITVTLAAALIGLVGFAGLKLPSAKLIVPTAYKIEVLWMICVALTIPPAAWVTGLFRFLRELSF